MNTLARILIATPLLIAPFIFNASEEEAKRSMALAGIRILTELQLQLVLE
jgi:hypothetical protein